MSANTELNKTPAVIISYCAQIEAPAHGVGSVSHHLDQFALGVDRGSAPEIAWSGIPRHSAMG
jgi:hypothetical protein